MSFSRTLSFVRFEHTVFALPLVYAGAVLGTRAWPSPALALLILTAAAGARTFAMALNRLIDAEIDARNPRTAGRELPSGRMTRGQGAVVAAAGAAAYLAAAAAISRECLELSPVPLAVFAGYPFLKRFTVLSHLGLGVADALGPLGAWVAARSAAGLPLFADATGLWCLALFATLWIAGFDVIYATQDEAVDRAQGLHALPAVLGREDALWVAGALHFLAGGCLGCLFVAELSGPWPLLLLVAIAALLILEHERAEDVEFAFFWSNAAVSLLVFAFVAAGVFLGNPS